MGAGLSMGEGSDNQRVAPSGDSLSCAEGSTCPQRAQPGRGSLLRAMRKASARIQGLKRGGSGSPRWGDWRTPPRVLARMRSWPVACREAPLSRSTPARAAPGPPGLPPGNGGVQELGLHRVELAAAVLVPLGMDPHAEGVFPF